uniref:Protein quiver n=1 Tax=Anopheles maculatus TaxID=74869 RepID=A0A182T249_9DIPT
MLIPILLMMIFCNTPMIEVHAIVNTEALCGNVLDQDPDSSVSTTFSQHNLLIRRIHPYLDEVIEDPTFITYYRSCTTDLCNDGDALGSSGSALTGLNEGASDNLLVPGLPSSGVQPVATTSPLLLIIKITSLAISVARIIA